jgi:hypothetical protein
MDSFGYASVVDRSLGRGSVWMILDFREAKVCSHATSQGGRSAESFRTKFNPASRVTLFDDRSS